MVKPRPPPFHLSTPAVIMRDKRKSPRRQMRYTAWLALDGNQLHGCAIHDISHTGARIDVENADIVPDRFVLLLSGNGKARRTCQVIWRQPHQIGVHFGPRLVETVPAEPITANQVPPMEPGWADDVIITQPAKNR